MSCCHVVHATPVAQQASPRYAAQSLDCSWPVSSKLQQGQNIEASAAAALLPSMKALGSNASQASNLPDAHCVCKPLHAPKFGCCEGVFAESSGKRCKDEHEQLLCASSWTATQMGRSMRTMHEYMKPCSSCLKQACPDPLATVAPAQTSVYACLGLQGKLTLTTEEGHGAGPLFLIPTLRSCHIHVKCLLVQAWP